MSEPVVVKCPQCGQSLQAPADRLGTMVSCSFCKAQFTAQASPVGATLAPGYPPPPSMGYAPPYTPAGGYPPRVPAGVTPAMVASLQATRPWVLFLAILGFIGCGLMVIVGLFMALGSAVMSSQMSRGMGMTAAGPCVLGVVYMLMALLYFFPSLFLLRYGMAIKQFMLSGTAADMERALEYQKSFWKFMGILTIVVMCLYLVLILVFVLAFGTMAHMRF